MRKQDKPKQSPILSLDVSAYKFTKGIQEKLAKFDTMDAYMKLAGKHAPVLRVNSRDYADMDAAVRAQSNGERELSILRYRGVPIASLGS